MTKPQTELPAKQPAVHRWIATTAYTLSPGQARAAHEGNAVQLGPENMFMIGVGCYDCEQMYGEHDPECPVARDRSISESEFAVEPIDGDSPLAEMAVAAIGQHHLLVKAVSTSIGLAGAKGDDRKMPVILLQLDGRFNHTATEGTQNALLPLEAGLNLFEVLGHSLEFLAKRKEEGGDT